MRYIELDINALMEISRERPLICFGAGRRLRDMCESFSEYGFFQRIDFIVDNDPSKKKFVFSGETKEVTPLCACTKHSGKNSVILITAVDFVDIVNQINAVHELNDCNYTIAAHIMNYVEPYELPINRSLRESLKIPKTIHYCWFGGNPIPNEFLAYMESWKKCCPDYEIVRWDENNYDFMRNRYMREAYWHKKWAFVTDVARLDIVNRHGGVYLDADVELLKNIDDLLCDDAFCGFGEGNTVNTGLGFGAVAGFPLIEKQLREYDNAVFVKEDGSLNLTACTRYSTKVLCEAGLKRRNKIQSLQGMKIYPTDVLSPKNYSTGQIRLSENTYAIHHFASTWVDIEERRKGLERWNICADGF